MKRQLFVQLDFESPGAVKISKKVGNKLLFTQKKYFSHFVKHMDLLDSIKRNLPQSIYALAKIEKKDVANITKIVSFYESVGALKMKASLIQGRKVKAPFIEYEQIIFEMGIPPKPAAGRAMLRLVRRR